MCGITIRIDTLAIAKRLVEGGSSREQADALAATWNEAIDMAVKDLATRDDLTRAIDKVAADQKAAIAEATNKQIVWTVATILATAGIVIAITRLL